MDKLDQLKGMKKFIDGIPGGVGVYDVYADGTYALVYLNDGYYDMIGAKREDRQQFMGKNAIQAVPMEVRQELREKILSAVCGDGRFVMTIPEQGVNRDLWLQVKGKITSRGKDKSVFFITYTDVTDYETSMKELMQSRKELQIATDKVGMQYWIYDVKRKESIATWENGFGYDGVKKNVPECFRGNGDIYPEDEETYFSLFAQMEEGVESCECYARIFNHKVNIYQWQHIVFSKLGGGRYVGSCVDVTEQMRAKQQYNTENAIRRDLMKDSVFFCRMNLTQKTIEERITSFVEIKDKKEQVSLTESAWSWINHLFVESEQKEEFFHKFGTEQLLDAWNRGESNVDISPYRLRVHGEIRWYYSRVTLMQRPDSGDIIAVTYTYDVNDKENNKLAIAKTFSEEMEYVAILDIKRNMIRQVSARYDEKFIPSTSNILFSTYCEHILKYYVTEEDQKEFKEKYNVDHIQEQLKMQQVYIFTYRCRGKEGEVRRKKLRVFYLDEYKERIVISRRDITDLYNEEVRQAKVLQEALDAAKSANRAKSVFLSQMSHDMRTPLNAIIGLSNRELTDDIDEKEKIQYLDEIHSSGIYLLGIINDVLDMSKIESGKMVLHPEPYALCDFEQTIRTVIGKQCEQKGIRFLFSTNYISTENQYIYIDKTRFNQIFINLLSNAVKFTPSEGDVELKIEILGRTGNIIHEKISVRDTGIGMSQKFLPHAFESFSQEVHKNKTIEGQGTGLGLAIVNELVKQMDGTIKIESELGKGTTIVVDLMIPLARADVEKQKKGYSLNRRVSKKNVHVLLCEDHPLNAKIAIALLEKKGLDVDVAKNGEIGVSMFEASPMNYYQMVFMDIRMPVMNGLEAAKKIRTLNRADADEVVIVAMTANAFDEDVRASLDAGMNAHLSKPIEPEKLYECIEEYIH